MKKFLFVMMTLALSMGLGTVACSSDDDTGTGDTDTDSDTDTDTDSDTDADTDSDTDTDADCGAVDDACCADDSCESTSLICVTIDSETGENVCATYCDPDMCTDEGFPEAGCNDISDGAGLGYCAQDIDTAEAAALDADNACMGDTPPYDGWCCPASMGGDSLGNGPEGSATCNEVDMTTIPEATTYDDIINNGVGMCLWADPDATPDSGDEIYWCAKPCAFDNSCDIVYTCYLLNDGVTGACLDL